MNVVVGNLTLESTEKQIADVIEPGSMWSEARDLEIGNIELPTEAEEDITQLINDLAEHGLVGYET